MYTYEEMVDNLTDVGERHLFNVMFCDILWQEWNLFVQPEDFWRMLREVERKIAWGKRTRTRLIQLYGPIGVVGRWHHPKNYESADVRARQGNNVAQIEYFKGTGIKRGLELPPFTHIIITFRQLSVNICFVSSGDYGVLSCLCGRSADNCWIYGYGFVRKAAVTSTGKPSALLFPLGTVSQNLSPVPMFLNSMSLNRKSCSLNLVKLAREIQPTAKNLGRMETKRKRPLLQVINPKRPNHGKSRGNTPVSSFPDFSHWLCWRIPYCNS